MISERKCSSSILFHYPTRNNTMPRLVPGRTVARLPRWKASTPPTSTSILRSSLLRRIEPEAGPSTSTCTSSTIEAAARPSTSVLRSSLTSSFLRPSLSSATSSLLSFSSPSLRQSPLLSLLLPSSATQIRTTTYGQEYQPSQRIRKRRHGFLARRKSRGGLKVLIRRRMKGRRFLSH